MAPSVDNVGIWRTFKGGSYDGRQDSDCCISSHGRARKGIVRLKGDMKTLRYLLLMETGEVYSAFCTSTLENAPINYFYVGPDESTYLLLTYQW